MRAATGNRRENEMELSIAMVDDIAVVGIAGVVDGRAGGEILDALTGVLLDGTSRLIVDMSGVTQLSRAAIRGLVVAAKMAAHRKGRMRICGATGQTATVLRGVGHGYLLKLDPVIEVSVLALAGFGEPASARAIQSRGGSIPKAA